jgi:hypothetical protein
MVGPLWSLLMGFVFAFPAGLLAGALYLTRVVPEPARLGGWGRDLATRVVRRFARTFLITMGALVSLTIVMWQLDALAAPLGTVLVDNLRIGPLVGLVFGLVSGLSAWYSAPAAAVTAPSPRSALHDDRVAAAVQGLAGGFVVALPMTLLMSFDGWAWGLVSGFVVLLAATLVFGLGRTASSWYGLAHVLLALRGKLPWRLMRFLDDAHGRGVLRQAGEVYQFRHSLLRDHLAAVAREG